MKNTTEDVNSSSHDFCSCFASSEFSSSRALWDTPLFETDDFVAVPSLGSLVPGWLLVVPRRESLCLGQLSSEHRERLGNFVEEIVPILESRFGPVAAFEHGPARRNSAVGCGVNYTHLHLVPTECDLRSQASVLVPQIKWHSCAGIDDTEAFSRRGEQYVYLQQRFGATPAAIGTSPVLPSQLFRRIIAKHVGKSESYDWKQHPQLSTISETVAILSGTRVSEVAASL
jgi:ATP adenylyltransferase